MAPALLAANLGSNSLHFVKHTFRGSGRDVVGSHSQEHTTAYTGPRARAPREGGADGGRGALWQVKPLVPGMNLPLVHMTYIFVAILISLVVHEGGHALAATSQGVNRLP